MKRVRATEEEEEINKPKTSKKIHYPKVVITNVYTNGKARRDSMYKDGDSRKLVVDAYNGIVDAGTFDKFVEVYEECAMDQLRHVCKHHAESYEEETETRVCNIEMPIGIFNAALTKGYDLYCRHLVDYDTFKEWRMYGLNCKISLFAECHNYMQTLYYEVLEDPASESYNDDIDVKMLELIKNYHNVLHLFTPKRVVRFNAGLSQDVDKYKINKALAGLVEADVYDQSQVFDFKVTGQISKYFWSK